MSLPQHLGPELLQLLPPAIGPHVADGGLVHVADGGLVYFAVGRLIHVGDGRLVADGCNRTPKTYKASRIFLNISRNLS